MTATPPQFSPWDMEVASINFGAMCGHGALAAAIGTDVIRVMEHFERGGWVNIPIMKAAIARAGYRTIPLTDWPKPDETVPAVVMIQWTGPWMAEGVPVAARCQHRHWVAAVGDWIWDCNAEGWFTRACWERFIPPALMPKRGTGFRVERAFLLIK